MMESPADWQRHYTAENHEIADRLDRAGYGEIAAV